MSRFFHTSALTVGITKNGAMTISRMTFWPYTGRSIKQRHENAAARRSHEHRADENERVVQRGEEIRIGEEAA